MFLRLVARFRSCFPLFVRLVARFRSCFPLFLRLVARFRSCFPLFLRLVARFRSCFPESLPQLLGMLRKGTRKEDRKKLGRRNMEGQASRYEIHEEDDTPEDD